MKLTGVKLEKGFSKEVFILKRFQIKLQKSRIRKFQDFLQDFLMDRIFKWDAWFLCIGLKNLRILSSN